MLGEEGTTVGNISKTPPRRHKMKGPELGESNTYLRRSMRLSTRSSKVGTTSQSREGTNSTSISDGDINNCNLRLYDPENLVEPSKLWEIGKQVEMTCRQRTSIYGSEIFGDYEEF